jgi:hypothetical protein
MLLIVSAVFELSIGTAFLPAEWQRSIGGKIVHFLPQSNDWTPATHPHLDQEIMQVVSEHIWLRVGGWLVLVILLGVNAWFMRGVWRLLHSKQRGGEASECQSPP